jgi:hypothetical protein
MGPQLFPITDEHGKPLEHEYEPASAGWAIRSDTSPVELSLGVQLEFGLREGRLECVAVRSFADGPPLSGSLLRRIGPALPGAARDHWERNVVRLREHEGKAVGVLPWAPPTATGVAFGTVAAEVGEEFDRHRQPITDERLARIAELWIEAGRRRERSAARYVAGELHYAPGTVRNLMKLARDRADEYARAKHELSPAQERLRDAARRAEERLEER